MSRDSPSPQLPFPSCPNIGQPILIATLAFEQHGRDTSFPQCPGTGIGMIDFVNTPLECHLATRLTFGIKPDLQQRSKHATADLSRETQAGDIIRIARGKIDIPQATIGITLPPQGLDDT